MTFSSPGSIDQFFQRLEQTLIWTWQESAFGHLVIDSQRNYQVLQEVLLQDSTTYQFAFTDQEIAFWKVKGMRSATLNQSALLSSIEQILNCLERRLLRTWEETGYGRLEVKCDRTGRNKIRVVVGGAPSYCFYLDDAEVKQWVG